MFKQATGVVFGLLCGVGIGAILSAKAAAGRQAIPSVVRAQNFQVVDGAGKLKAEFGSDSKFTFIKLYSVAPPNFTGEMMLAASPDGGQVLTMGNGNSTTGISLMVEPGGKVSLALMGTKGKRKIIAP